MGVYLPNVDVPKDDKVVTIQICPEGSIWQQYRGTVPNAKAVPVPPHGRLIDAWYIRDAIIQKWMDKAGDSHMYKCGMEDAYEVIRNAPTIIPADPAEEG